MSGILNTVLELTEGLGGSRFIEDNLLYQLHQKLGDAKVAMYGDMGWTEQFGEWFTRYADYPPINFSDVDSSDNLVKAHLIPELENGSDFDFMILHMIGMDCVGHSQGSRSPEITRKLLETEKVISQIIEKMDEETTLVVFGDHGMTEEGSHGGSSELEMRTTFFAYQKTPLPMGKTYRKF